MDRRRRQRKIDIELATDMYNKGRPMREIAEEFGVTRQAVSKMLRAEEVRVSEQDVPPWPWKLALRHVNNPEPLYRLMSAYRKHQAGLPCTQAEVGQANALRKWAERLNAAVTYDRDQGFMWVSRRESDSEEMFVVR